MALKLFFSTPMAGLTWTDASPPKYLSSLSANNRKAVLAAATKASMDYWAQHYLPLKFTKYVEVAGGYRIASGTRKKKQRRARFEYPDAALPNVWSGETRTAAKSAVFKGRGTSSQHTGKMIMNLPQYVNYNPITNLTVRSITQGEGNAIAQRFFQMLRLMVSSGDLRMKRNGEFKSFRVSAGTIARVATDVNQSRFQRASAASEPRQSAGG